MIFKIFLYFFYFFVDPPNIYLHLAPLQLFICPREAHGLEALEVGQLSTQPRHTGTVWVGDTGGGSFDVPRCHGGQADILLVALEVAIASDKGGKENKGKKYGAVHHWHCCHWLPRQK